MKHNLKPDVAAKLVALLRTPEFKDHQTMGYLRRGDCYCILGVICELYRRETGVGGWTPEVSAHEVVLSKNVRVFCTPGNLDGAIGMLPEEVVVWATEDGRIPRVQFIDRSWRGFDDANDAGLTFEEFAKALADDL